MRIVRRLPIVLRYGVAGTAALAPVVLPLAAAAGGLPAALSALTGLLIVAAFFSLSVVVAGWAERRDPALMLPAALGTYLAKVVLLAVIFYSIPPESSFHRRAFAFTVLAGTLTWVGAQSVGVWRAKIPYVQLDPER